MQMCTNYYYYYYYFVAVASFTYTHCVEHHITGHSDNSYLFCQQYLSLQHNSAFSLVTTTAPLDPQILCTPGHSHSSSAPSLAVSSGRGQIGDVASGS